MRLAMARACLDEAWDLDPVGGQVMDGVGVVPEDAEVGRGRRHGREPLDCRCRIDGARRIAVLRHAPDPFDARISGDQPFHFVHIRPVVSERDRDHLDAEVLADCEMAVVAWHRAEKRDACLLAPRARTADGALEQRKRNCVVHERQARVVAEDDLRRRDAEERRQQSAQLGEALEDAVVARIRLVEGQEVVSPGQAEEAIRQIELFARRFAAGEIELQPALLEVVVAALDLIVERGQIFGRERFESGHASGDHSAAGAP